MNNYLLIALFYSQCKSNSKFYIITTQNSAAANLLVTPILSEAYFVTFVTSKLD